MKPSDFLTNIVDFFAVLLPGAIFIFALYLIFLSGANFQTEKILTDQLPFTTQGWVIFTVASYISGSFIFFVGALLDGKTYNWMKENLYDGLRKNVLGKVADKEMWDKADECKNKILGVDKSEANFVVKLSKANIYLFYPGAATELHRFEANSKFFRSLSIVALFLLVIFLINTFWVSALICLFSLIFTLFSYIEQRFKYLELAAFYLIVIHNKSISEKTTAQL